MSFRTLAAEVGALRPPSLRLPESPERARFIVDAGQDPERVASHYVDGNRKKCLGDACPLCAAGLKPRVNYVASIEVEAGAGIMAARNLWLNSIALGTLAQVLPESGHVWIDGWLEPDPSGKVNPRTGETYQRKMFALAEDHPDDGQSNG
jgi:hypothetical protein